MSVDITGGDGSLYWKAGIDTSDLESGMQKVTDVIQLSIKKQVDLQQQAISSQKQMAQTILQSAGALKGMTSGLNGQASGLASFSSSIKTLSTQVGQYVSTIEGQLAGLEGESIDIKGRVDSKPLLDALTVLKSEIGVINSDTISLHAEAVDVQPLLKALDTVQKEYDRFSQKSLTLSVTADTSGLNGLSNTLSQTSVDAFKSHKGDIIQAISAYKQLQTEGAQALDTVAQHVHGAHGAVEAMDHAMHDMAEHAGHAMHDMAGDINEVVQATNQGTVSLRQMADAVKGQTGSWQQLNTAFHGIFHGKSGDASLGAQWQQIKAGKITLSEFIENLKLSDAQLQKLPAALEKAGYVAKGTFAGMAGEAQAASGSVAQFSREVTQSIQALEAKLKTLEGHSLSLNTRGVDTTALNNSLSGLKSQLIDIKTGKVDVSSVETALKTIEAEAEKLSGQTIELRVKSIDTASVAAAFEDLKKKIASVNQSAIDLKVSGVDTASLTQSLERARAEFDRLKGLTLSADINTEEFQKAYERLQQEVAALEGNTINLRVAGVDTREVEAELAGLREKLNLPALSLPVKTGSLNEKTRELESLKAQYAELSAIDRNSDIGKGLVTNIQKVEGEIENVNKAFLKVEQHAAGSLNEKVAQLQKLKDQYAALSDIDRRSTVGRGMAQNISNLDREVQKINGEFQKTESLIQKAGVAIGAYLTLQGATNFIGDLVRVRGEFQQLEVAFNTMLGSKAKADKLMAEVTQLAATTPFTLQEVAGGAKQLLAYEISADEVTDTLRRMGDIAAGTGANLSNLILALGQVKSKGKLEGDELRQFAEANVNVVGELSKMWGKNEADIRKMVEQGKVGFSDLMDAIKSLTSEGGKFFNLMEAQSHTLTGQLSNLQDAWSRMLNDMGKSQEGLFSGAISAATDLVNNYQTVLDILKVLIATYGSYRVALLVATELTRGYTIVETLRYRAMLLSEGAMKLLNKTMLSNPYVATAAAVTALVTTFIIFKREVDNVKTKAELLAQSQKDIAASMAETEAKIRPYIDALKSANLSEQDRLNIYNELKKIDPKIVEGIDAKTISYEKLKNNVNAYLTALRQQITLEGNKKALQASIEQENAIKAKLKAQDDLIKSLQSYGKNTGAVIGGSTFALSNSVNESNRNLSSAIDDKNKLLQDLKDQEKVSQELGEGIVPPAPKKGQKTLEDFLADQINLLSKFSEYIKLVSSKTDAEKVKKALTEKMESFAPGDAAKEAYKKRIQEVNELLKKYSVEDPTKGAKKQEAQENKINDLLEQRKGILQGIVDLQREAQRSVSPNELSEIDKINQKYDEQLLKIQKFNEKVDEFNRKRGTNVQKIGLLDIAAVNEARVKQVGGEVLGKQGADILKADIDAVKGVFEQYGEAVKNIGVEKADAIFQEQTQGFSSFVEFLQAEAGKLSNQVSPQKMEVINKALQEAQKKQVEDDLKQRTQNFQNLLTATLSYKDQETAIYRKYNEMEKALEQNKAAFTVEQYQKVQQKINDSRAKDLQDLRNAIAKQAPIFQSINADLFTFSKDAIRQRVKDLKDQLAEAIKTGKIKDTEGNLISLTPKMIETIKQGIQDAEAEAAKLGTVVGLTSEELNDIARQAQKVAGLFSAMADAIRPVNSNLSDVFSQLSDMANMASTIASAAASFAAGDYLTAATQSAQAIGNVVKIFIDAKRTAIEAQQAVRSFYNQIRAGEIETHMAIRERMLLQAQANKLTLEGLTAQKKQLDANRKANQDQFNELMKQIQQEEYIAGQHTEKGKGSAVFGLVGYLTGIGAKTSVVNDMASLAGKSFDQLEELFNKGQLSDRAKDLFQQLQKLKAEGVDIDKQLQDLKDRATEVFTGTTADSLTRDLAQMFKQGKTSAEDFADFFQDKMQDAMINALQFQAIEPFIKDFMQQFSDAAQSDGALTAQEIEDLKRIYTAGTEKFREQFDQLQQISGLNFNSLKNGAGNSLSGAIKGITETQAELLAGQFGGLRLTALDQLKIATQSLTTLNAIQANTGLTVVRLESVVNELQDQTSKMRQWLTIEGIKVR